MNIHIYAHSVTHRSAKAHDQHCGGDDVSELAMMKKKLRKRKRGKVKRNVLRMALNVSWKQHITNIQLYGE